MRNPTCLILTVAATLTLLSCRSKGHTPETRLPVDTVGFATRLYQTDSVLARIDRLQAVKLKEASARIDSGEVLKVAIAPHDDYSYVGYLYPALLQYVRSEVVILFGVGHKAKSFGLGNKIVFGSFRQWKSPGGTIKVSDLQESILNDMPGDMYIIHDSLQTAEHSLEALIPFIEHYNPAVEIIPVIVPHMPFGRMEDISRALSRSISETMEEAGLKWGEGWSMVISTDAVHYGNEEWGGNNYDRFGVDSAGYITAVDYEKNIMDTLLAGELMQDKIQRFSETTVRDDDYREYKWTWCGRYAVPLGLLTALDIADREGIKLTGIPIGYSTSIAGPPIPVTDLGMGVTAPARLAHWVGYPAVGYRKKQ